MHKLVYKPYAYISNNFKTYNLNIVEQKKKK